MKRSTDRILTTHTGSLPRPDELTAMLEGRDQREADADPRLAELARQAVREVVRQQVDSGVDVVNDGEVSKVGYSTYVTDRITGFEGDSRPQQPRVEEGQFPEFYKVQPTIGSIVKRPVCTGPIAWQGTEQVQRDIANFKAAIVGVQLTETFMTSASPGVVWNFLENDFYPNDEAYVFALAEAMSNEYHAIAAAGLVLQLDCPDLAMGWNRHVFQGKTVDDFRKVAQMHVEALNHALTGIPPEQVRLHLCWGNYEGPHIRDVPLNSIWDIASKAHVGALSFEGANPRHEHEWALFRDVKLPDGMVIIPGVLDSTTNFVEHPELVAQRLERYAGLVGRENVIAGTDCGFATFARTRPTIHPTVTWAKFQAMAEGAKLASQRLWG